MTLPSPTRSAEKSGAITFHPGHGTFHLKGTGSSYLLGVPPDGDPQLLHWGTRLSEGDCDGLAELWKAKCRDTYLNTYLENRRREYATFGNNDLRSPALHVEHGDGSRLSAFTCVGHEILEGKPRVAGLPGTTAEPGDGAVTLRLALEDKPRGQLLTLTYTLYPALDIVVRRAALTQAAGSASLRRMLSASVDFPAAPEPYWSVSLPGDWARERMVQKAELKQGIARFEGRRGSQFHRMSPFVALTRGLPAEETGQAWGFAMVYSGNWLIEAETHSSGRLRVGAGINDFDFQWLLEAGQTFVTPECVMAFSSNGLGGMSRKLHDLVRDRVCGRPWRDQPRPVLLNSWEGLYFGFKHDDIVALAREAKDVGADLLVLDDGWFGKRDDDRTSLGDWVDDTRKLPDGIKGLARDIHALGLKFGLWFEPEAISPDSELFRRHPDWALTAWGRPGSTSRNQHVLDMSRKEVLDYLWDRLSHFIEEAKLDYIKWDMNRPLWELGSDAWPAGRQCELSHRFVMGTYELMGRLRDRYPQVLVEGCTGGGGRFDLGMLCYHPQFWTSDNTDAVDRIFIQWGSSLFLPPITMGSHISAVPNHQTGRSTPMTLRAHVAMSGNLGLELNPAKLSPEDKAEVVACIARYKEFRHLLQRGDLYRLEDPFAAARSAWMFVAKDKGEAVVFVAQTLAPLKGFDPKPLLLAGLDPESGYSVDGRGPTWSGATLMSTGLVPALAGDFASLIYRLKRR